MNKTIQKFGVAAFIMASVMPSTMKAGVAMARNAEPMADLLPVAAATQMVFPMRITAYSSSVDETDSTPFITANGTHVRDGIVATNMLPFGTKVKIPSLFGEKVFVVEDRMAKRMRDVLDIWMSTKEAALRFGANRANVVVLTPTALSLK